MVIASRCARFPSLALTAFAACCRAHAEASPDSTLQQLAQSSIEDLMNVRVTSVAGTPQARETTPAALYVISSEDIRRSGHRTVAEALRLVPGMYVARINSSSWLVGSRGLTGSSLTATRYLVLIDGRLVYDPLISTTFWDTVDLVLADVERIEVIRGPGATLWGANAMNGVINIVTKSAHDTQGTLVQLGAGTQQQSEVDLRHGVALDADSWLRVWGKYTSNGDFRTAQVTSLHDEWSNAHAGFRYDKAIDAHTTLTLQGDAYHHPRSMERVQIPLPGADRQTQQITMDDDVSGANVLMNLRSGEGQPTGWSVRAYYDQTERDTARFGVERHTADADLRSWFTWGGRNDLIWGAEYLWTQDDLRNGPVLLFTPDARSWEQLNAFVQNTTKLVDDKLFVMVGNKFTYHSFVGTYSQPNARIWWTPDEDQTLWASVSRPVRIPSRFEEDGLLILGYADIGALTAGKPNGTIVPLSVSGNEAMRPEELVAYELGHRVQLGSRWLLETSLYYNDYRRLIEPAATVFGPFTDVGSGRTWGIELSSTAQLAEHWRLEGSYSWQRVRIDGPVFRFEEKSTPRNLAQLRSSVDVTDALEFNAAAYYVDRVPQLAIDAYTRLDIGFAWRASPRLRLEVWGQNLLDANHSEASGALIPRGVFGSVSFSFD
jgi:iron complex outermembrane receptor protein